MQLAPSLCANSEYSEWLRKIDVSQRLLTKAATTGEVQVGTDLRGLRVAASSVLGFVLQELEQVGLFLLWLWGPPAMVEEAGRE